MSDSTLVIGKAGPSAPDQATTYPQLWLKPATDENGQEVSGAYILCVRDDQLMTQLVTLTAEVVALRQVMESLIEDDNGQNVQRVKSIAGGVL